MAEYKRHGTSVRIFANADPKHPAPPEKKAELQDLLAQHVALIEQCSDLNVQFSLVASIMVTFCMSHRQPFAAANCLLELFEQHMALLLTQAEGRA